MGFICMEEIIKVIRKNEFSEEGKFRKRKKKSQAIESQGMNTVK